MTNLLPWMVLVPLIGALFCLALPSQFARVFALGTSIVGVVLAGVLYFFFDAATSASLQLAYEVPWIPALQAKFALGVDGLSFPLVLLTKLVVPVAILSSWAESRHLKAFMVCYLLLDFAMTGTFLTTDIVLFYVFWELMLIPMLLLIGVWGGSDRIYASLKFFLYTFAGSVLMLVAIFFLYLTFQEQSGHVSSHIPHLQMVQFSDVPVFLGFSPQDFVFLAFAIAFLIKVPLFPLHTWLPDAHVQAPTGGSILLAAVLLKMGTYGLLRFAIPMAPESFLRFAPWIAGLSLIGIVYGAWVAFQQTDMKKLVAYSSVSHLGFVVLGICALNAEALSGAILQNINHGLSTGALFYLVGVLYERRHTRNFSDYGGIAAILPWFSIVLVIVAASSMAVPGLNGFVGEFLILLGVFRAHPVWAAVAVLGVIFGALYLLFFLREILWGETRSSENRVLSDLSTRDWAGLIPLLIFIFWLGISPGLILDKVRPSIDGYWSSTLKRTFEKKVTIRHSEGRPM